MFYVGDRVKQPGQLNGKSANLNHVMLKKIFPGVRKYDEIPPKDIIMVIDCDHMVKPEIFNKMGPCMLDEKVAVTLVPQVCCSSILFFSSRYTGCSSQQQQLLRSHGFEFDRT